MSTRVNLFIESSQQVAVDERLRKREPFQLAPGMAFFINWKYLLLVFLMHDRIINFFLSYIYLNSEMVVVGGQPRALFGSLLSIAVSLRCILSGEMLSRVTLPFVRSLSTA